MILMQKESFVDILCDDNQNVITEVIVSKL